MRNAECGGQSKPAPDTARPAVTRATLGAPLPIFFARVQAAFDSARRSRTVNLGRPAWPGSRLSIGEVVDVYPRRVVGCSSGSATAPAWGVGDGGSAACLHCLF
ncbi:hypothetical protein GCM10010191_03460 [Actinomadura vinacea]|uniref:Uncharacterized protein n=1 Tax=Actinomadura vinacea TaxID=115336 RepID=A0ABN3IBI0_9ACTN